MLKEKKEKNLIAAIIKFLCDKLKELIRKIFARDLSFDQRLDKEIKELQEKLNSGELSEEEFARALERLTALQDLKLRLQMAVVGWIVTMFAEMFGVELAAAVEASTEKEDKKAEKTSLEANKEVHKDIEIKVDEREKPAVPVFLFDFSSEFVRPVVLSKPELDLLPKPMKELMPKEVIKEETREVKPKVEEEKKAKPEEQKKEVCPPAPKTAANTTGTRRREPYGCNSSRGRRSSYKEASNQPAQSSVSNGQPNQTSENTLGKSAQESASDKRAPKQSVKNSIANCGFDFNIGTWNGAENEGSVNNAQPPKGLTNDVKVEKCAEGQSVGKT
ncbi:hypothetical protein [Wolbachia endosymbiont (group A) of Agelastica alni]